jgi:uncharacterized SAM-binding protein YcdF (DUF218 family)
MKIICILFHVGKKKSEITQDSRWRLLAGAELAKKNEKALVLFVGGGGLEISGAELLKEFWVKNFPEIKNEYFVLNSSNNTFDNLKEVQSFLAKKNISFPEVNIIKQSVSPRAIAKNC